MRLNCCAPYKWRELKRRLHARNKTALELFISDSAYDVVASSVLGCNQHADPCAARFSLCQLWRHCESLCLHAAAKQALARSASHVCCNMTHCLQIVAFVICGFVGGYFFYRWWLLNEDDRRHVWRWYGTFTGLICCGSWIGVATWSVYLQYLSMFFVFEKAQLNTTLAASPDVQASAAIMLRWSGSFSAIYAIQFAFLCITKLMVLDRLFEFSMPKTSDVGRRWAVAMRVVMAGVTACNAVGIIGNLVSAAAWNQASDYRKAASVELTNNNPSDAQSLIQQSSKRQADASSLTAIQKYVEVAVLLVIIVFFTIAGIACTKRVSSSLARVDDNSTAAAAGRHLRRQILSTTAVVLVTFLLRGMFSTMFAVADNLQNSGQTNCSGLCDDCKNVYTYALSCPHACIGPCVSNDTLYLQRYTGTCRCGCTTRRSSDYPSCSFLRPSPCSFLFGACKISIPQHMSHHASCLAPSSHSLALSRAGQARRL